MIKLNAEGFPESVITMMQEGLREHYLAAGYIDLPQPPDMNHRWTGSEWVPGSRKTLKDLRLEWSLVILQACKSAILSGFDSDALGATHHYPAKDTDQQNLLACVTDSLYPNLPTDWLTYFWCRNPDGVWEFRAHTALQIQQVGREGKAGIMAAMGKNELLQTMIATAQTVEDLESIQW